jgi:hypothetical protein
MVWARQSLVVAFSATVALGACDRGNEPSTGGAPASSASASTADATTRAVITVDVAHDMMTIKDATAYVIAPSAELVIEIGEHRFSSRDAGSQAPDAVHVVHGSSGYHRASFTGTRAVLNAASLDPVKGGAFRGFEAGESYIVAVGAEAPSAADGAMRFLPVWTAKVNVASR